MSISILLSVQFDYICVLQKYVVEKLILRNCTYCKCMQVMSQFANLEFLITLSSFSISLDFEIQPVF